MVKNSLLLILFVLTALPAIADDIYVYPPETTRVAINQAVGSLVEFTAPIKVVADTAKFKIEQIATETDKDGNPIDVTIVKVTPRFPGGAVEEVVPFLLAGKKAVNLRFFIVDGAPKHQKVVLPKILAKTSSDQRGIIAPFLEKELTLMRLMLRDEEGEGFAKRVVEASKSEEPSVTSLPVEIAILRAYEGHLLSGYILEVKNLSDKSVMIEPTKFTITDSAQQAVLFHTDRKEIFSCQSNPSKCSALIRLVLRGQFRDVTKESLPFRVGGDA